MDSIGFLLLVWLLRLLCGFVVLTALAPLLKVGWWPVRLCDFPRMQLGVVALVVAVGTIAMLVAQGWRWNHGVMLTLAALVAAWQFSHIVPYTGLWKKSLPDAADHASPERAIRLAVLNLDYENDRRSEAARTIESLDVDVLVLVEADQAWVDALAAARSRYPHEAGVVRGEGLGLLVWSTLPIRRSRVEHLVTKDRPSVWANIELRDGRSVNYIAVHPTPPGLEDQSDDGREDSRKRDAELVLVARTVASEPRESWIVAGDFNDVAWSHTTRLFTRLSGLNDPRIGRGLYSTYHAAYPPLRYPIDHVFASEGFAVIKLARVEIAGSDHLGILAQLVLREEEGVDPEHDRGDAHEANEIVDEGREDATND